MPFRRYSFASGGKSVFGPGRRKGFGHGKIVTKLDEAISAMTGSICNCVGWLSI